MQCGSKETQMSRFYGPGAPKINAGYQPREGSATKRPVKRPDSVLIVPSPTPDIFIRFVLKSGAALELKESSLDEVVGTWADRICKTVCGIKADGTKTVIPVDSVDYMEAVQ
jgi:hypothetical protein